MCEVCRFEGRYAVTDSIHHIDPDAARFFDFDNLLSTCTDCHRRIEKEADRGLRYKQPDQPAEFAF